MNYPAASHGLSKAQHATDSESRQPRVFLTGVENRIRLDSGLKHAAMTDFDLAICFTQQAAGNEPSTIQLILDKLQSRTRRFYKWADNLKRQPRCAKASSMAPWIPRPLRFNSSRKAFASRSARRNIARRASSLFLKALPRAAGTPSRIAT